MTVLFSFKYEIIQKYSLNVLALVIRFYLFLLAIVLSILLRFTSSDFGIMNLKTAPKSKPQIVKIVSNDMHLTFISNRQIYHNVYINGHSSVQLQVWNYPKIFIKCFSTSHKIYAHSLSSFVSTSIYQFWFWHHES
jgi:hypothetical protein